MQLTKTVVAAKQTKTGAWTTDPGVDVSGIIGEYTLVLEVYALNDGDTARFTFADSVDNFSSELSGPSVSLTGKIDKSAPVRYSWRGRDFPNLRLGVGGAKLRIEITEFDGASKSVTFEAWIES
jgi:hypothetical protein